jgi:hypothetical protein
MSRHPGYDDVVTSTSAGESFAEAASSRQPDRRATLPWPFQRKKRRPQMPLGYRIFFVAVLQAFIAAGDHLGGPPLAMAGVLVGTIVALAIILVWAARPMKPPQ